MEKEQESDEERWDEKKNETMIEKTEKKKRTEEATRVDGEGRERERVLKTSL